MCDTNLKKNLTWAAHLIPQNIPKNHLNLFDPAGRWVERARSQWEERNRDLGVTLGFSCDLRDQPSLCPFPPHPSPQNIQGNTTSASSVRRGTREARFPLPVSLPPLHPSSPATHPPSASPQLYLHATMVADSCPHVSDVYHSLLASFHFSILK